MAGVDSSLGPVDHAISDPEQTIMFNSAHRARRMLPLVGALFMLAGCASITPIGQLLDNSSHYDGKTVRIKGEVKSSAGLLGRGAYQVKDNTGTLTVVSEGGSPPRTGSEIGVKGKFQALFTLGSTSLAVLLEQSRFQP